MCVPSLLTSARHVNALISFLRNVGDLVEGEDVEPAQEALQRNAPKELGVEVGAIVHGADALEGT